MSLMLRLMALAAQQSQARGETPKEMNPAKDADRYKEALEQIANAVLINGVQAQGIARDALGIKPKGGGAR